MPIEHHPAHCLSSQNQIPLPSCQGVAPAHPWIYLVYSAVARRPGRPSSGGAGIDQGQPNALPARVARY